MDENPLGVAKRLVIYKKKKERKRDNFKINGERMKPKIMVLIEDNN